MTELRKQMIGELRLRNRSQRTIDSYVGWVYQLARHYRASPDTLSLEQIRRFLLHLAVDRDLAPATVNVAFNALVFLYREVLGWSMEGRLEGLQRPRVRDRLPKAYGRSDMYRILHDGCPADGRPQLFLMTVYSTGMRLSEACSLLWRHSPCAPPSKRHKNPCLKPEQRLVNAHESDPLPRRADHPPKNQPPGRKSADTFSQSPNAKPAARLNKRCM